MTGEFLFPDISYDGGLDVVCGAISDCCRQKHIEPDGRLINRALSLYILGNTTIPKLRAALRTELDRGYLS